jgi:hypothetical protein
MTLGELVTAWRRRAAEMEPYTAPAARAFSTAADELEAALASDATALLSLNEAARHSGYSPDHLGRLVHAGRLRNYGTVRRPRLRLSELPRKPQLTARHDSGIVRAQ